MTTLTLIEELTDLYNAFEVNKDRIIQDFQIALNEKRLQAETEALAEITKNAVENMRKCASGCMDCIPRKQSILYEFDFNDKFNGCFIRDLLNLGNLIKKIQDWFDTRYVDQENKSVFKVYHAKILRNERLYGIFVSWDKQDWKRIDDLMKARKREQQIKGILLN